MPLNVQEYNKFVKQVSLAEMKAQRIIHLDGEPVFFAYIVVMIQWSCVSVSGVLSQRLHYNLIMYFSLHKHLQLKIFFTKLGSNIQIVCLFHAPEKFE